MKAINAAIEAKQWKRLSRGSITSTKRSRSLLPAHRRALQEHRGARRGREVLHARAAPMPAVEMYLGAGKWATAERIAQVRLSKADANKIFLTDGAKAREKVAVPRCEQLVRQGVRTRQGHRHV